MMGHCYKPVLENYHTYRLLSVETLEAKFCLKLTNEILTVYWSVLVKTCIIHHVKRSRIIYIKYFYAET